MRHNSPRNRRYARLMVHPPRRHLSMLRSYTPADLLTIGNASCGTIAILLCLDYMAFGDHRRLWMRSSCCQSRSSATSWMATSRGSNRTRPSLLGSDLDSLADVISFGVAPAVLGFTLGLRGGWDMLVLTYFVVCGVSRLARFNATAIAAHRRRDRQGDAFRRHADSNEHPHRRASGGGSVVGPRRRRRVVWSVSHRTGDCCTRWCWCTPPAAAR